MSLKTGIDSERKSKISSTKNGQESLMLAELKFCMTTWFFYVPPSPTCGQMWFFDQPPLPSRLSTWFKDDPLPHIGALYTKTLTLYRTP